MITSVYNYYLSNYYGKEVTKYDSHKKDDLKNIYSSMLRLNRKMPLYKFENLEETQRYAIDIKESARIFKNVAASMTDEEGNLAAFSKKKAGSSNEQAVSVCYQGDESGDEIPGFEISVSQLAGGQENISAYMTPEKAFPHPGSYSFDLSVGKFTYEFSFDVEDGKSNEEVQNQIARLINRAEIGILADIVQNENGKSALRLQSEQYGVIDLGKEGRTFDIVDNQKGDIDIVDFMGLNQVHKMPENARFTIDGVEHSVSANEFTVLGTYDLELHEITDEPVRVELKPDFDAMLENVTELTDSYNQMLDMAKGHMGATRDSGKLYGELKGIAKHRKNELDSAGFTVDEDGYIRLEESLLIQSAKEGTLDKSLQMLNQLKKDILRKTDMMSLNPMAYVDKKLIAYPNPLRSYTKPYVSSIYSGMMFDGWV